ncbi:hypothetical protein ABB55_27620 [Prosthecomicrobium hirschii]|uniref:Uncharacterized protein n=1 Tax=Prosthecodimorpha hirschii TaxID=665126 RepID=A0A0N8GFX5_9HYPH|nr:hypothetical protein [Prosthecomicrobium hirschii]KPL55537.1 hypothetical protein ABB55_27620 [Prosthecomicrobium hirschii]
MTQSEFIERFVAHMIAEAGETFPDGTSVAEYARETAQTYWDDEDQRSEGPEECADCDMSYWEASA